MQGSGSKIKPTHALGLFDKLIAPSTGRKFVVLLLSIYCLMYFPLFVGVLCLSLFCYTLLCAHSSFAIILKRKRKPVALLLLS